ncbi:hypothetical protein NDU88_007890 [Pleurodeles waltl]|uniref:Uncharacterized protein n=1 Tax=Pleurodeles waltl TaxID=8319 RepID=A0AAV7RUI3_PLEWA|nr:hypothetical protein NDU88_007890 [Pleurodeles waltl]
MHCPQPTHGLNAPAMPGTGGCNPPAADSLASSSYPPLHTLPFFRCWPDQSQSTVARHPRPRPLTTN